MHPPHKPPLICHRFFVVCNTVITFHFLCITWNRWNWLNPSWVKLYVHPILSNPNVVECAAQFVNGLTVGAQRTLEASEEQPALQILINWAHRLHFLVLESHEIGDDNIHPGREAGWVCKLRGGAAGCGRGVGTSTFLVKAPVPSPHNSHPAAFICMPLDEGMWHLCFSQSNLTAEHLGLGPIVFNIQKLWDLENTRDTFFMVC